MTRQLATSLEEVEPYFPIFERVHLPGRLMVVPVEHDRLDASVPVIAKMNYRGNLAPVVEVELDAWPSRMRNRLACGRFRLACGEHPRSTTGSSSVRAT